MQYKKKTIVPLLCLITAGLLVVVVHCSADLYWFLCEREALGLNFPVGRALSEALECSTENANEASDYCDRVDTLIEDVEKAVTIELDSARYEDKAETDSEITRARAILSCLRENQVFKQVSSMFTGLPSLLDTGIGDRVSILLVYLYMLDRLDVDFRLFRLGRNVSVFVGEEILGLFLPGGCIDGLPTGHDQGSLAGASTDVLSQRGKEVSPRFILAQYRVGLSSEAVREGENNDAIRHCLRAAFLAPNYSTPYLNMGIAHGKLDNHSQAARWFEKAIKLDPARPSTYIHYGNCLFKAGDVEKAGEYWQKGRELASLSGEGGSNSDSWVSIADNNLSVLSREMEFIPIEKQVFTASFVSSRKRVFDISRIERNIRESTGFPVLNEYQRARELFTWVWDHYDFEGYESSSSILDVLDQKRGNCATFTTLYAMLFKRFGLDTNVIYFGSHVFLSFEFEGRRVDIETTFPEGFDTDMHKGRPDLKIKGLEVLPALIYHNQAVHYLEAGNSRMAGYCLEKAIERFPELALSYSLLADIYVQRSKIEKALNQLLKAVELDPYYAPSYAQLGILLFLMNRPKEGARALNRALYYTRYDLEPEKMNDSIVSKVTRLLALVRTTEEARLLEDLVYLPPGVKDTALFKKYVDWKTTAAMYKVDFKGDQAVYRSTSLGDMLEAESVAVYNERSDMYREANRGKDGQYYYASGSRGRVVIDTGSMFFVPLEEVSFEL